MDTQNNIEDLLARPMWQMTGKEYCSLMQYAMKEGLPAGLESASSRRQAVGMTALSKALGCSASLLYGIRHNTNFEPAIISHIGRKPVFDVEVARKLANDYMERAREERRSVL